MALFFHQSAICNRNRTKKDAPSLLFRILTPLEWLEKTVTVFITLDA
jgi:hypothetical protein